jgi:hypothetical protein
LTVDVSDRWVHLAILLALRKPLSLIYHLTPVQCRLELKSFLAPERDLLEVVAIGADCQLHFKSSGLVKTDLWTK